MSTQHTEQKRAFNEKVANAAHVMFSSVWSLDDPEAAESAKAILKKFANEKSNDDDRGKAFSAMVGACRAVKVPAEYVINMITGGSILAPDVPEKVPMLVTAWMTHEPSKTDAVTVLEALKKDHTALLPVVVKGMKSWDKKDKREILSAHPYTEELWIAMAEVEKETTKESAEQKVEKKVDTTVILHTQQNGAAKETDEVKN
jgi:hypothetical protein